MPKRTRRSTPGGSRPTCITWSLSVPPVATVSTDPKQVESALTRQKNPSNREPVLPSTSARAVTPWTSQPSGIGGGSKRTNM
jgi:hypothetical protein